MLKKLNFLFLFFLVHLSYSQVVSTKDPFPTGETDITVIVDLKLAKDGRAAGLLGKTSDIFFWSGAGDDANGNAFKYTPTGQSNFNAPFDPGKMTSLGNDKWSITINPRAFYKVPIGIPIKKLGIVVKNGEGNSQTEDLFLDLFEPGLKINIIEPKVRPIVANKNDKIPFRIKLSEKADVKLSALWNASNNDIKTFEFSKFTTIDSLNTTIDLALITDNISNATLNFNINASNSNGQTIEIIQIVIVPDIELAKLPEGIKNGLNYIENEVILSFFAPKKKFIYLLGDFNNWEKSNKYLFKKDTNSDTFWIKLSDLEAGKEYAYQFLVDGNQTFADPYAEKILDPDNDQYIPSATYPNLLKYPSKARGIVSVLQTSQKPYEWKATNYQRPKSEKLIVYELLIRDFTKEGNYKAAMDRLPYLKNLGINAIELMPVSEFTNNDSWGYNPTFYCAPDKAYGTKNDLKTFIDECHKLGIAVIIDMVLNQADEAFPYVKMYFDGSNPAADSPFFNPTATHPFSVFRDFNHESTATQSLVDQVNKYWLEEFKIDGFRFDLSKGFTQNKNSDVGAWSNYDASRIKIWKRIYDQIRKVDKTAYVILEHFAANSEEQELADYGMMFWGNANGDYRNTLKGNLANLAFISPKARSWQASNLIGYMESHDEERLMFDLLKNGPSKGNYFTKDLNTALERAKAATAIFMLTDGPKMIWQFGELGYDVSIDENGRTGKKPVRWEYFDDTNRKKLYKTYAELTKLKGLLELPSTKYNYNITGKFKSLFIENTETKAIILANFDLENFVGKVDFANGTWYDYFTGKEFTITNGGEKLELKPGEFHIFTTKKFSTPEAGIVPWAAFPKEQILSNEPVQNLSFQVSPNPSSDKFEVKFSGKTGTKFRIDLVDISGKSIENRTGLFSKAIENETFDTKKLPSGIFLVKVYSEGNLQTGKFLKE